jgi:hypothetical protein
LPLKNGNKLVELRKEIVKGLTKLYGGGSRTAPDFTTFVNELLQDIMRKEEFLSRYKPFSHLTYAGYYQGSIFIKDNQKKLIAEIIFKDGLVYCNSPDSNTECEHARFAVSLIDVAKYSVCLQNK